MLLCGIDEAGRGPLAGPVCAAAIVFHAPFDRSLLADSKKLTETARKRAADMIWQTAAVSIGWASPAEIDHINILAASLLAMERAFCSLGVLCRSRSMEISHVSVDGNKCPKIGVPCTAVVRGDQTVPEIQAASIIAKQSRDLWMTAYDRRYPGYGFAAHKGYPTNKHRSLIALLGPCPIHRRTFRGVVHEQT